MTPADYQALVDDLIQDEGERLKPYVDTAGKITIGCGRNLSDNGISGAESQMLLSHDIEIALNEAQLFTWFAALDPVRQRVVLNMLFNLGGVRFAQFRDTIAALARKNYPEAARHMLASVWAKQVKGRADRLAEQMRIGTT